MPVNVVKHPLLAHHLANLRLASTTPKEFRQLVANITTIIAVDAMRAIEQKWVQGEAPLGHFEGQQVGERIGLVPILRAGLGMVDAALQLLPDSATVLHIGLFREKVSLQPVEYYSKLPAEPTVDRIYILDPLIATGGTVKTCVQMINDWGIPLERISLLSVLGSRTGVEAIQAAFPVLDIWIGAVDPVLNDRGYIIPGLGDTGDRLFNTVA